VFSSSHRASSLCEYEKKTSRILSPFADGIGAHSAEESKGEQRIDGIVEN
jgi:hypothetical protein